MAAPDAPLMTPWEASLQILKFIALGITTASGCYATLKETKEKSTGTLTKAGRAVFACLIASSLVALLSQTLETKNTLDKAGKARQEEQDRRQKADIDKKQQLDQLQQILTTAESASKNSSQAANDSSDAAKHSSEAAQKSDVAVMDLEQLTEQQSQVLGCIHI